MKYFISIILMLFPGALFATTWATVSVGYMIQKADLVAVCKVINCPWEEDGYIRMPCDIKIKVINVLIGNEKDTDLLVDWVDFTSVYEDIKEGKEYVVFLQRWDAIFLNQSDKGDRRIKYKGTDINNNYMRFNSEYWIREIVNGEIIWTNNKKISISNLVEIINKGKK